MANKIREGLHEKIDKALAAAKEKEGKKVTATPITPEQYAEISNNKDLVAYKSSCCCLLYDGRYIDRFEGEEGKLHWRILDNVPVDTLRALVKGDHDENADERRIESYMDYGYEHLKQNGEYDEEYSPQDKMDNYCYHWRKKTANREIDLYKDEPEDILLKKEGSYEDEPVYNSGDYPRITEEMPLVIPETRITDYGTFDEETKFQLKRVACEYFHSLSDKQKEYFWQIFGTTMEQKEVAEFRGVGEQAVSNKKNWFLRKAAEKYRESGFGDLIPDKAELKEEKKVKAAYKKYEEAVSREVEKEYFPDDEADAGSGEELA